MARIVNNTVTPVLTLFVKVIHENGAETVKTFKLDDTVDKFRYVHDKKIKSISGRVAEIVPKVGTVKRFYTNAAKLMSYFKWDVTPDTIVIDASEKWFSDLNPIPVREILEDEGVTEVERIETWLGYGFTDEILLSDNTTNTVSLEEGQFVQNLEYLSKGTEATVSGRLVAITYNKKLIPESLKFIVDGKLKSINVVAIKSVGETVTPVDTLESLNDAITAATDTVYLGVGTYVDNLTISKSIKIMGVKAGLSAVKTSRDKKKFTNETVLTGKINITDAIDVVLDGLVLTKDAFVDFGNAKSLEIKNCMITGLVPNVAKSLNEIAAINTTVKGETLVKISHCYFGESDSKSEIFNNISLACKLADGSSIDNNYFVEESSMQNSVNILGAAEDAIITIRNNVWEMSKNAIRIGTSGDPKYVLMVEKNTYIATDDKNPDCAGLLVVQPNGFETTGWKNTTIHINKTSRKDKFQLFYLYSDGDKMLPFTDKNLPTIFVDGRIQDLSKYVQTVGPVDPIPPVVDTTELDAVIAQAKRLNADLYTEESYMNVMEALSDAEQVDRTSQDDIDAVTLTLKNAIDALVEKPVDPTPIPDTKDLDALIASAKALDGTLYTEESYAKVTDALLLAENVDRTSQEAIDLARNNLNDAIEALVLKDDTPVTPPVEKTLTELIDEVENGGIIELEEGFSDNNPVVINKSVHIKGATDAVVSGAISISEPVDVVIENVTLTGNATVNTDRATSIKLSGCIIKDLTPDVTIPDKEVCAIYNEYRCSAETVVQIENCEFGGNVRPVYNTINLYSKLKNGSYFKNNHFTANSCTHNHINIYDIEENATIEISGNEWEMSKNAIRLGPTGNPVYTMNIFENIYNNTDTENPDYAGLLILQPLYTDTTGWSNATIILNDTIHTDELQLFYLYAGENDTKFHENSMPTIIVDGEPQDLSKWVQIREEIPVDTETLDAKIAEATALDSTLYTEESYAAVTEALTAAENVDRTSQEAIDEVVTALTNAINALVLKPEEPAVLNLAEIIAAAEDGAVIELTAGVYENTPVTITKNITLKGAKFAINPVPKNPTVVEENTEDVVETRNVDTLEGETVFTCPITTEGPVDVVINGVALTKDALINITGVGNFSMNNVIVSGISSAENTSIIKGDATETESVVTITGCYFGDTVEGTQVESVIKLFNRLATLSKISNNYFTENSCTGNHVEVFKAGESATIDISHNEFKMSRNAIRLGIIGNPAPAFTVNLDENIWHKTCEETPERAGLLVVQPYGVDIYDMSSCVININGSLHADGLQKFYLYTTPENQLFTTENVPTINIDGIAQDLSAFIKNDEHTDPPVTPGPDEWE